MDDDDDRNVATGSDWVRPGGVVHINPKRSDAEIAAAIRADLTSKLNVVCKTIDAAKIDGFEVSFQLAKDGNGQQFVSMLVIAKHY